MLFPPLPRNIEASFRDLASERPDVRAAAIGDVVRHARTGPDLHARAALAVPPLLADASSDVRAAAAVAVADLGVTEAVPRLLLLSSDDDGLVRQMAISALGELADPRALPRLEHALRDPRPDVRYQAVIAFTRVSSDAEANDRALLRALSDDDRAVVHIALRSAEQRHDEGTAPSDALVERACALIRDDNPDVSLAAAILAAKRGRAEAHPVLLRAVHRAWPGSPPGREEEQAAVELVGILGLAEAIPALERRAFGLGRLVRETCSFSATIALAALGHEKGRRTLLAGLSSRDAEQRRAAIVGVGRARVAEARAHLEALLGGTDTDVASEALRALGPAPG